MTRSSRLERSLDRCVEDKQIARDSGNYARNLDRVCGEFVDWLGDGGPEYQGDDVPSAYAGKPEGQFDPVESFDELGAEHCADYARLLRDRVRADEISGSTAHTYYNYIRAFLEWAVEDEYLRENPARAKRAKKRLPPESPANDQQQIWTPEQRDAVLRHASERVDDAMDDEARGWESMLAARDRALVALLAYSGVRGAEVLRDPNDDRRDGVRWRDLTWPEEVAADEAGTLSVLGKSGDQEDATVLEQAEPALQTHHRLQDPPNDYWPIFPTFHRPTLYDRLREELTAEYEDVDEEIRETGPFVLARDHGVVPPTATTEAGRSIMQRLCDDAEIDFGEGVDYLQPHGGRRGLGDELYMQDPRIAQDVLRHQSIETTNDAYRERKARRDAGEASRIIEDDS